MSVYISINDHVFKNPSIYTDVWVLQSYDSLRHVWTYMRSYLPQRYREQRTGSESRRTELQRSLVNTLAATLTDCSLLMRRCVCVCYAAVIRIDASGARVSRCDATPTDSLLRRVDTRHAPHRRRRWRNRSDPFLSVLGYTSWRRWINRALRNQQIYYAPSW